MINKKEALSGPGSAEGDLTGPLVFRQWYLLTQLSQNVVPRPDIPTTYVNWQILDPTPEILTLSVTPNSLCLNKLSLCDSDSYQSLRTTTVLKAPQ